MRLFWHQLRWEQLIFWRSREAAVFVFLFPLLLFALLTAVYNGKLEHEPASYVLLAGMLGGREHPHPWWLALPAAILAWEVARGWRRTPRCHLWEAGVGAFALALGLAAFGLTLQSTLLVPALAASIVGCVLLWLSRRREPRPWRAGDVSHYERRAVARPKDLY